MRFAELDAVTLDAHGTLLEVADPVPALDRALRERGVERSADAIGAAFAEEGAYYRPRSFRGRDDESLERLRHECATVFLGALDCELEPDEFVAAFIGSIRFDPVPGTREALLRLRRRGLALAVVSNWDATLPAHLSELGLDPLLDAVVTSAAAGVAKPDPAPFQHALDLLGVRAERTLHVGDDPVDEQGARGAGLRFAAAPLPLVLGEAA
jgi:putative hydrolase of the HAD superfamily